MKKTFYIFLSLLTLFALVGGLHTFFFFFFFSILIFLFIERIEKKETRVENQVLIFFSLAAMSVILSGTCANFLSPAEKGGEFSLPCFIFEILIFTCGLTAVALHIATCFRTGGKTARLFLMIGLLLLFATAMSIYFAPLLFLFLFFYCLSRSFIDWLPQRFKFWLFLGLLAGWAFIIGTQKGALLNPQWPNFDLLSSSFYAALLRFILTVTFAFTLYLPMSLILGSRKTRTKAATSYILLSAVPIIILVSFLWLNFFLQIGIFHLYTVWKDNIDFVHDLANVLSTEIGESLAIRPPANQENDSQLKLLCQKYEDFLSLRFHKASVFVNVFGPASEEPVFQCSSQNGALINPSDVLYPEWIENETLTWIYQENGKLYLKGAQFNNYGDLSALVRLYIPFEFQDLDAFSEEYKLSILLYKQPIPAQDARRVGKSGITMSGDSLENILFRQGFPILVQQWESGAYLTAGMITFLPFKYFTQMKTPSVYSAVLYGILISSFFLAFVIIVFSSILGYVINRNMRKAFDAIVNGAHHFSSGDFDHRISLTSKDEYRVIGGALNQMAIGIKQYTEDMIKKELMERELSIASEVQRRIFPQKPPELAGFDFGIVSKPYGKVGGDYYDFIEYPDGEVAVVVADASGKGMPAALMVSSLNAILHSYEKPDSLTDFLSIMNSRLWKVATENAYITLVYCLFQSNGEDIQYVNAGHPHPLLFNSNHEFTPLAEGGASLGMFDSIRLRDGKVRMESGDIIAFVTDGILETVNASEEEFGTERLKEAIAESHLDTAQEIAGKIFAKLREFSSSEKFADDATCIVIKKL